MDEIVNFVNDFHDEDAPFLCLVDLEQLNLESTTALAIDTSSTELNQEYGHLGNTMTDENASLSMEACEPIEMINNIFNSDAGTQTNTNDATNPGPNANGKSLK